MAKLWSNSAQNAEQVENPISVFLENIKWQLWVWNKEEKKNDFHILDRFLVLNIWYTIKWQVWDDSIKKYTSTYFSNEVGSFNEKFYAIKMTFSNWKAFKTLAAQWTWNNYESPSEAVKPKMPAWIGLKVWITILDLNDWLVKEFFVWISDYINNIQAQLREAWAEAVSWYSIESMYTNWTKDSDGKEIMITEKALDEMKWSQAADYKRRYISTITSWWEWTEEEIWHAEEALDKVIASLDAKKAYYKKTYWNWVETSEWKYAKLEKTSGIQSDEDFEKEVKAEAPIVKAVWETKKHDSTKELSIDQIPF